MTSASVKPFVRRYNPTTDFDDVVNICKVTAHPSIHAAVDILPYIYAIPYVSLEPENSFVLDTGSLDGGGGIGETGSGLGDGRRVVGYIIGTANTVEFVARYQNEYLVSTDLPTSVSLGNPSKSSEEREIRDTFLRMLHEPEGMLHLKHPGFLEKYPGHLHIDILPSHQNQGYGSILMSGFLHELRDQEVKGVHLGMRADNTLAQNFYKKHLFEEYADIRMDGTTWMVKGLGSTQTDGN